MSAIAPSRDAMMGLRTLTAEEGCLQDIPVPAMPRDACLPSCTVVICTRARPTHLERCLTAVARLVYAHFEVLVVDNAPSDVRTREVAAQWGVRYISEPVPGLSRARNRGAQA